jgi:hypothetical protein
MCLALLHNLTDELQTALLNLELRSRVQLERRAHGDIRYDCYTSHKESLTQDDVCAAEAIITRINTESMLGTTRGHHEDGLTTSQHVLSRKHFSKGLNM